MSLPSPVVRRRSIMTGLPLAVGAACALATSALAQGPSVTVAPTGTLPAGAATLTVTGTGFDPAGNGIYVVFGPVVPAPTYYMDPSIYGSFKWVHAGANESPAEAPLAADGSFSTTIDVTSTFSSAGTPVDCSVDACAVITFAAHGSPDRTQDTCTQVAFAAGTGASAAPMGSPAALPSMAVPSAAAGSAAPAASMTPAGGDACAAITAAAAASSTP
jgi:hypothetical protein